MTHNTQTCQHETNANGTRPRRSALNRRRLHDAQLAYDGVTAEYIRDIAGRPAVSAGPREVVGQVADSG
jgi:hypothetical protein